MGNQGQNHDRLLRYESYIPHIQDGRFQTAQTKYSPDILERKTHSNQSMILITRILCADAGREIISDFPRVRIVPSDKW